MREIGGYFGLEEFTGREYHHDLIGVNSGRNALLYILKAKNVKKLYIPNFLCDTVYRLCEREGYLYEFYSIDENLSPVFSKQLAEDEWLYIVNFYGQISNKEVCDYKGKYGNIILDNVQAFFQKPVRHVDTVYSCRKFFGVADGGYVSTDKVLQEPLTEDNSRDRMSHILGRFEKTGYEYYSDFQLNEETFYQLELKKMSRLTENVLRGIDYELVRQKRNDNYAVLANSLGEYNGLKFKTPDGPYCYPFYCENSIEIRKELAKKRIYVATLWPNVIENGNALEKDYAQNILPLPCDQRYNIDDMKFIIEELKRLK